MAATATETKTNGKRLAGTKANGKGTPGTKANDKKHAGTRANGDAQGGTGRHNMRRVKAITHRASAPEQPGATPVAPAPRRTRDDLLTQGLALLAEGGIDALTIDALCTRIGATKGSFYHHFTGRDDFLRALLEHWATPRPASASRARSPRRRMEALLPADQGPETAIRAWAMRDPTARDYQRRVDARRLDELEALLGEATGDPARAALLARMGYALLLGAQTLAPPVGPAQRAAMLDLLWTELCIRPARSRGEEGS